MNDSTGMSARSTFDKLHGSYLEELSIGMDAIFAKTFTEADVLLYSAISGDTNPLHLNEEFASQTRFGTRILHGMLTTSLWSTIVGTLLPGPGCAYMGQELNFYKPVHLCDTVTAKMTVTKINTAKQVVYLHAEAFVKETLVAQGQARVWVPRRPS
ncbi:MAG: MaoC family dehydratase [Ardenticatenaceae bacterium]